MQTQCPEEAPFQGLLGPPGGSQQQFATQTLRVHFPKGSKTEKIQSRLQFSISLEMFNPDLLNFPLKTGVWWVARLKISISLEHFEILNCFNLWALSQGVSEYGWESDWENRWALIRSHSWNQSGVPTVLGDSLRASPSTVGRAIGKTDGPWFGAVSEFKPIGRANSTRRQPYLGLLGVGYSATGGGGGGGGFRSVEPQGLQSLVPATVRGAKARATKQPRKPRNSTENLWRLFLRNNL